MTFAGSPDVAIAALGAVLLVTRVVGMATGERLDAMALALLLCVELAVVAVAAGWIIDGLGVGT